MRESESRAARFERRDQREEFIAVLEQVLPGAGRRAQFALEFAAVILFWGFIVYMGAVAAAH